MFHLGLKNSEETKNSLIKIKKIGDFFKPSIFIIICYKMLNFYMIVKFSINDFLIKRFKIDLRGINGNRYRTFARNQSFYKFINN